MAFLIYQSQQVAGSHPKEVQDVLIVGKFNLFPLNALFQVLLLFLLEDGVHEKLLQRLVGKVNAQLLKAVKRQGGISSVLHN